MTKTVIFFLFLLLMIFLPFHQACALDEGSVSLSFKIEKIAVMSLGGTNPNFDDFYAEDIGGTGKTRTSRTCSFSTNFTKWKIKVKVGSLIPSIVIKIKIDDPQDYGNLTTSSADVTISSADPDEHTLIAGTDGTRGDTRTITFTAIPSWGGNAGSHANIPVTYTLIENP